LYFVRAFITGIAGFAGSHLAEHLLACGDAVAGCSLDGAWLPDAPPALAERVTPLRWDIAEPPPELLARSLIEFAPDVVFHLAAVSIPSECGRVEPTPQAMRVNVDGTRRVVELAARLPSRPRVLLASSCRVYGPVDASGPWVTENSPLGPSTAYAKTKLAAEEFLRGRGAELGVEGIIVRAANHAGPRQSPKLMLSQWCRDLVRGDDPVRVHCLNSYVDMTDVRDIVRAYRLLAEHGRPGEVYNVGSGVSRRSGEIFEQLRQMQDPQRSFVEQAPGRHQDPIVDLAKTQSVIPWRPEMPLPTTLRDTLDYWAGRYE
jgi:GDP-4-dehydro-6-deoxy-D-mannose reductase